MVNRVRKALGAAATVTAISGVAVVAGPAPAEAALVHWGQTKRGTQAVWTCNPNGSFCWWVSFAFSVVTSSKLDLVNGPGSSTVLVEDKFYRSIKGVGPTGTFPGCLTFFVTQNHHFNDNQFIGAHYLDNQVGAIGSSNDLFQDYVTNPYKEVIQNPRLLNWYSMELNNNGLCLATNNTIAEWRYY